MFDQNLLILVTIIPCFVGILSFIDSWQHRLYTLLSIFGGFSNLALLLTLKNKEVSYVIGPLNFQLDGYGYLFAFLVSVSWIITAIYSHGYLTLNFNEKRSKFYTFLSFTITTVIASGFANTLFTLILFYTLSSISILYLLVNFKHAHQKIKWRYFFEVIMPPLCVILPVCIYLGILYIPFDQLSIKNMELGHVGASSLLAIFIICFSKNCVMPFHRWLPASSFAPAPLSALIHTVGAVQVGVIAIIKITRHMYTPEYLAFLHRNVYYTGWMSYLCGLTALYTAYCAWKTTNLKRRFSFSTVGQLSYIISAIIMGTHISLIGALLHIITHSFAKMSLFFSAGILSITFNARNGNEVSKVIPLLPWLIVIMGVSGLSISGIPFLAGFYSKDIMLLEEIHTGNYSSAFFLLCGSFINLLYIYPILKAGFNAYYPKRKFSKEQINSTLSKVNFSMIFATILSFFILIFISIFLDINSESVIYNIFKNSLNISQK